MLEVVLRFLRDYVDYWGLSVCGYDESTRQTAETFTAPRICASVGFLPSVRPNVSSLMLKSMKSLIT